MSIQNTTLIISNKENMTTPSQISGGMRQIERWSQQHNWNTLTLQSGFTPGSSPFAPLSYLTDPLGFVHIHGAAAYTGGAPSDHAVIAILPTNISPQTVVGPIPFETTGVVFFAEIVPAANGAELEFRTATGASYPSASSLSMDFIYDPRI